MPASISCASSAVFPARPRGLPSTISSRMLDSAVPVSPAVLALAIHARETVSAKSSPNVGSTSGGLRRSTCNAARRQ